MRKHPKAKILIIAPFLNPQYNAVRDSLELVAQKWGVALFDFKEIPDWYYQRERNYTDLPNPDRADGRWQTPAGDLLDAQVEDYNVARYSYDGLHPSNLGYERMWRGINAKLI
jgi:lysophospholipase L1-like esterase